MRCDAAITLFSTTRVAAALWRARVPYRLAPATKFAQLLYTDRQRQRRPGRIEHWLSGFTQDPVPRSIPRKLPCFAGDLNQFANFFAEK